MIHKNWRNRWYKLQENNKFKVFHTIITLILGTGISIFLLTKHFVPLLFWIGLSLGIGTTIAHVIEIFFVRNSMFDDEEEMPKKVEQAGNENKKDVTYDISTWQAKKNRLLYNIPKDNYFQFETMKLIDTIEYITKNCVLSEEDMKYLFHDFPNEMCEILQTYERLQGKRKRNMEFKIIQMMRDTCEEWQNTYIEPLQQALEDTCMRQIENVYRKEEKQEKMYITE